MSLAYPGESSVLSDIVGREAFLEALDDQALRVYILEKEPKNLHDALNLASRLEVFDIYGFYETGNRANQKNVRVAAGGNESSGSGEPKLTEEVLKQLADLKGLVCSYRRDLE